MRRPLALFASTAVLCVSCGGSASSSEPDQTTSATGPALETTTTGVADASATSTPRVPTVPSDQCEDTADPAEFAVDQIPQVVRPCVLPTELVVQTIRDGDGAEAEVGDTLVVDFTGVRSEDGFVFDTSYDRGTPLDFELGSGGVIQGWDDGLVGATAGSLVRLDVPSELAYGQNPPASDVIGPGDALTFVIEVRAVIPAVTADDAPLDLDIEPSIGATELGIVDLSVGSGAAIELGHTAVVHLLLVRGDNEVVLFNTWERMDPLQIIMEEGQTLPGMFEGLLGATVGSMRVITMPPELAFGAAGDPSLGLPAGTDLIAVIDVVGVY